MYDKDAPEKNSTEIEEADRLNEERKPQGEDLDQPAAPGTEKST